MRQCWASWPKARLAIVLATAIACVASFTMIGGHGRFGDQQLAKRLRTKIMNRRLAEASALHEQAATLRAEAELISSMDDTQVVDQYSEMFQDVEFEPDEHSVAGHANDADPWPLRDTLLLGDTQQETELEAMEQNGAADIDAHLDTKVTDIEEKITNAGMRWMADMNNIKEILSNAQDFVVSEANSADFEALSKQAYDQSLKEEGLDNDPRQAMLKKAADTGEFEVSGGMIGNLWARLPKDNPWKIKSTQAFIGPPKRPSPTKSYKA